MVKSQSVTAPVVDRCLPVVAGYGKVVDAFHVSLTCVC